jgi:ATP phosphoribosyltransferase regulatory subunit
VHGYQYLTGLSFSVHIPQDAKAILRGGRYDNVGLAFGRSRPACGFSIYLRALAAVAELEVPAASIVITRGSYDPAIESIIDTLREQGKTVVRLLPGESVDALKEQFNITHELVRTQNSYELKALGC